ncbi:MAG: hypothetical protein JST00_31480 [Deltaproteobacteria bacterium]|nr:hypothetical protein [Deltaproteobacteria bacterium]
MSLVRGARNDEAGLTNVVKRPWFSNRSGDRIFFFEAGTTDLSTKEDHK